jgi:uncharacterized phage-associated protein
MATYSAADVAAEIRRRMPGIPVKKLHKLLYYCQGWHAATFARPLFSEAISAWDMGPVVGSLWFQEKQGHPSTALDDQLSGDEAALNTIGFVLGRYGHLSGTDLEHLTHSEPPWIDANAGRDPHGTARIEFAALVAYFHALPADDDEGEPLPAGPEVRQWLSGAAAGPAPQRRRDSRESLIALRG